MPVLQNDSQAQQSIAISLGDPAGIGPEIILKALASSDLPKDLNPVIVGCKKTIEKNYESLIKKGISNIANPKNLRIENMPYNGSFCPGKPSLESGEASFRWLNRATEIVMKHQAKSLVTAPIAKHAWHEAGHHYSGQTERLGELTGIEDPTMLFTAVSPINNWRINTLLATTHIPLKDVATTLNPKILIKKLDLLLDFCKKFKKEPKICVAGMNPHAGEEGNLGLEEINWIKPTLKAWKERNPEISLIGPMPPDTCWISSAHAWNNLSSTNSPDGILALYHDQGLIPIKLIAFDYAVNTTLGLPFIRTSPDHGTGFDIADQGVARPESMIAAINASWELSQKIF